jgi:hypothetical protein
MWAPEKQKAFYSGITDTLREYIAARYRVGAMEMTTAEIFNDMKSTDAPADLLDELRELFERADFVKFAKFTASDEDNAKALPTAVRFVTSTYQAEIEGDEEPENKEESGGIPEDTETEREPETPEETVSPEEEIPSDVPKQEKESAKEKLKKKFQRKKEQPSLSEKFEKKMEQLQRKAEEIRVKKDRVMTIIEDEKNQLWLKKLITRLKKLLIYLVPQIDKLYLHFGFKDPSSTGKTLGLLSLLYPVCEDRMQLEPEFESQILEGEAAIKGRIRLIRLVAFAVPSFINPRFFKLIKQVKRI